MSLLWSNNLLYNRFPFEISWYSIYRARFPTWGEFIMILEFVVLYSYFLEGECRRKGWETLLYNLSWFACEKNSHYSEWFIDWYLKVRRFNRLLSEAKKKLFFENQSLANFSTPRSKKNDNVKSWKKKIAPASVFSAVGRWDLTAVSHPPLCVCGGRGGDCIFPLHEAIDYT